MSRLHTPNHLHPTVPFDPPLLDILWPWHSYMVYMILTPLPVVGVTATPTWLLLVLLFSTLNLQGLTALGLTKQDSCFGHTRGDGISAATGGRRTWADLAKGPGVGGGGVVGEVINITAVMPLVPRD
ncbi:MAG: hypothetical protein NXY57DRAFT_968583 [Lentinula lateritia]|nr:MAG: hypothetical protein NXY57DRAFT_968583 [Lentinula lateritia]